MKTQNVAFSLDTKPSEGMVEALDILLKDCPPPDACQHITGALCHSCYKEMWAGGMLYMDDGFLSSTKKKLIPCFTARSYRKAFVVQKHGPSHFLGGCQSTSD